MNYYSYSLHERTPSYNCCLVKPNFTPRKTDAETKAPVGNQINGTEDAASANAISSMSLQEKTDLCKKLNNGQGGLTLQEWDDFLADMVDMGFISNDERMYANGLMREIPEAAQGNGAYFSYLPAPDTDSIESENWWTGDPLKWLEDMDLFLLKNELYANLECKYTSGCSAQRDAYKKVSQILRDILQYK